MRWDDCSSRTDATGKPLEAIATRQRNQMANVAVIQGSSRGIGRSFVRHLLARSNLQVVATSSRPPSESKELILSKSSNPDEHTFDQRRTDRLHTLKVNALDEDDIEQAAREVEKRFGKGSLKLLINVSGVLLPDKSIQQIDRDDLLRSFELNTFAHVLTFKHFLSLLPSKAESNKTQKAGSDSLPPNLSILASLTARVGSIGDNGRGGWLSYRASKAATNQAIVTLNRELSNRALGPAIALALHPGTVAGTDLSRPFVKNEDSGKKKGVHGPDKAAGMLLDVLRGLGVDDGGRFLDYEGKTIPW